ncbi:hypothetical protein Efla_000955 [Eimeria flavescens]
MVTPLIEFHLPRTNICSSHRHGRSHLQLLKCCTSDPARNGFVCSGVQFSLATADLRQMPSRHLLASTRATEEPLEVLTCEPNLLALQQEKKVDITGLCRRGLEAEGRPSSVT